MATQKIKNSLIKGMNQDRAWTKVDPDQYNEASNFRLLTDDMGDSMGSISTVRGNLFDIAIPDVGNVYTITATQPLIESLTGLNGAQQQFSLKINNNTVLFTFSGTDVDRFYSQMAEFINDEVKKGNYEAGLVAQANDSQVIVYSSVHNDIFSVNDSGWSYLGSNNPINAVEKTKAYTNLQAIGQTRLRESAILFTTSSDGSGGSQIWKIDWDSDNVPTITLVRNANDGFTLSHDIEARGRYELPLVQRVYYTDFRNPLRSLNVYSETSFLDRVNISPDIKFDIPVVQSLNQNAGSLPSGWYSYAYRYKNLGGAETAYSQFSQPFPILEDDETSGKYTEYTGCATGTSTFKSLSLKIDTIDTEFTFIDIIVKYSEEPTTAPKYYFVEEDKQLSGAKSLKFDHHDLDISAFVDEADVLIPDTVFTKCKTIAIKDNRLIAGNLKDDVANIDTYDAHVYRYPTSGDANYRFDTNKVNPFNRDSTAYGPGNYTTDANLNRHIQGTRTLGGSPEAGGQISFKFVTQELDLDNTVGNPPLIDGREQKINVTKKSVDTNMNGKDIPLGGLWNSYKNPFIASHFRGYMRSEVYRFGIVFFDKSGRAIDAKWIADIRMPESGDPGFEPFVQNGSTLNGYALGVEFTVGIPSAIKGLASGFSIVRAERTTADETILAQGLMSDVSYHNIFDDRLSTPELVAYSYRVDRSGASSRFGFGKDAKDGTYQPYMHELHTLTIPRLLLTEQQRDISSYKIRPITGVTWGSRFPTLLDSSFGIPGGNDHTFSIAKWYNTQQSGSNYFSNVNEHNNYYALSIDINDSRYLAGMDSTNPKFGEELRGVPWDNSWIAGGAAPIGGFQNYVDPISDPTDERDWLAGSEQLRYQGRGGFAHFVNVNPAQWTNTMVSSPTSNASTSKTTPAGNSRIMKSSAFELHSTGRIKSKFVGSSARFNDAYNKLLFNLYREAPNQYGGDSIGDIESTRYISTGHYQAIDSKTPSTVVATVYGGDTYINVYDEVQTYVNDNSPNTNFAKFTFYSKDNDGVGSGQLFPIEGRINLDWREGNHMARSGDSTYPSVNFVNYSDNIDGLKDPSGIISSWWGRENNASGFFSESSFTIDTREWDNRVWTSDPKINGESTDSWRTFRVNEFLDVDGNLGPINKLETFNNQMYYFQDRAFGKLAINPNPIIQGDNISIALGEGKVLQDNNYISTNIGSKHQFSVFTSPRSIYWFDLINKRPYRFDDKIAELSDMKGMHSFFADNIDHNLLDTVEDSADNGDNPARRKGIIGTYDDLNNEALFTFLTPKTTSADTTISTTSGIMPEGSLVTVSETKNILDDSGAILDTIVVPVSYDVIKEYPFVSGGSLVDNLYKTPEFLKKRPSYRGRDFTLAYSEVVDAWSAFFDFNPTIYVNTNVRLLTPNHNKDERLHIHNVGPYNKWYGDDFKSQLDVVSALGGSINKVYDNVAWHTVSQSKSGARGKKFDQITFDKYYAYNDYQHTGDITLDPSLATPLLRRVEREWQMAMPRNVVTEAGTDIDVLNPANWDLGRVFNDRIRDRYLLQHFEFDNRGTDKFSVDYINTYVRASQR